MSQIAEQESSLLDRGPVLAADHFVRGRIVTGDEMRYQSRDLGVDFTTPALNLGKLVTPRSELPPLLDVPLAEIIDFLAEVGERLDLSRNIHLQDCLASRFVFVEGDRAQIEKYCGRLAERLGVDREVASAVAPPLPGEMRDEIEVMKSMGEYQVWGKFDGRGLVILSDEPVEFHPTNKTANVVMVPTLDKAIDYVNVATQTVGVWPPGRKTELRDRVASAGGQRLCQLGSANRHALGNPHDAMYPLQRFVHWMSDDDI